MLGTLAMLCWNILLHLFIDYYLGLALEDACALARQMGQGCHVGHLGHALLESPVAPCH